MTCQGKSKINKLKLSRYPLIPEDQFLAYDAGDQYILNHLTDSETEYQRILVIEDDFGAIGSGLEAEHIIFVNDSILARRGIINNFEQNNLDISNISFISPYEVFPDDIDLIILKIPKVNKYLDFLLNKLNKYYNPDIPFIAGGMVKYLNSTIYKLFQSNLGDFSYSLTWKKAKIITGKLSGVSLDKDFTTILKDLDISLINFPNLFSSNRVDIGSRFLIMNLSNISLPANADKIIDVGSANGILGLSLGRYYPKANFWLTDISFSAYESALATIKVNNFDSSRINLVINNSLDSFQANFADLIIINPPFHEKHKISIKTAHSIFMDCARVLKENGLLIVVANRHLGYHKYLPKLFSQTQIIQQNSKFFILKAAKPIKLR